MWQLQENSAEWNSSPLALNVDLRHPELGLHRIRLAQESLASTNLLRVVTQPAEPIGQPPTESYVRGNDLVATYAQSTAWPVRPQIYWRGLPADLESPLGGVELVVSAQTSLLDADPQLATESRLPASEAHLLCDIGSRRFKPVDLASPEDDLAAALGAFLIRPADRPWSYLEMIYPSDFAGVRISATHGLDRVPQLHLTNQLFPERLEKGVIRRGRVRGLFLPRANDEQAAVAAYEAFSDSPLPLTT